MQTPRTAFWRGAIAALERLPQGGLSRLAGRLADIPIPRPMRRPVLSAFAKAVGANLREAELPLEEYSSLDAFFVRRLRAGVRPWRADPSGAGSPVDGVVGQLGGISRGRVVQAKGIDYSAEELLDDAALAERLEGGTFVTLYLAPRHYHRIHAPCPGRIVAARHVPGALFPVNAAAVASVPELFARNERLVCHFETDFGPMAVVMVGALLVSGVETVWSGEEIPAYGDRITSRAWTGEDIVLERFEEMARFNYGSTVVVLLPPGVAALEPGLGAESPVRLGQALARRTGA